MAKIKNRKMRIEPYTVEKDGVFNVGYRAYGIHNGQKIDVNGYMPVRNMVPDPDKWCRKLFNWVKDKYEQRKRVIDGVAEPYSD